MAARGALLVDCGRPIGMRQAAVGMTAGAAFWVVVITLLMVAGEPSARRWLLLFGVPGLLVVPAAMVVIACRRVRVFAGGIQTGWRFIPWDRVIGFRFDGRLCSVELRVVPAPYGATIEFLEFPVPADRVDRVRELMAARGDPEVVGPR